MLHYLVPTFRTSHLAQRSKTACTESWENISYLSRNDRADCSHYFAFSGTKRFKTFEWWILNYLKDIFFNKFLIFLWQFFKYRQSSSTLINCILWNLKAFLPNKELTINIEFFVWRTYTHLCEKNKSTKTRPKKPGKKRWTGVASRHQNFFEKKTHFMMSRCSLMLQTSDT